MKRVALYLRVSTDRQTVSNQEQELRAICERQGWQIVETYQDRGISGAKGRDQRPAFDALCKDAARRRFDMVMAWSVDRLGRSLIDLVTFLKELHALKIDLFLHQQGIDTTTPAGKAMFQLMGVFSEFERAMIVERVNAGLARFKKHGPKDPKKRTVLGRPKIADRKEDAIVAALKAGDAGIRKIARMHKVGTGTVQRIKEAMAA